MLSLNELSPLSLQALKSQLSEEEKTYLAYDWKKWARPSQIPPDGLWDGWLIIAGRGWGKTRVGSEAVRAEVESGRSKRIGLIAETAADGRDVIVEGESGILTCSPAWNRPIYEPSKRRLTWPNGAIATLYDAREPDQLRGPQHDFCFVSGTLIETDSGPRAIEGIKLGDKVLTRAGFRPVEVTANRLVLTGIVTFSNGAKLVGTAQHPVLTSCGWTKLHDLSRGALCVGLSPQTATSPHIGTERKFTSIGMCGERLTGLFRAVATFITKTTTNRTTRSKTWSLLSPKRIASVMLRKLLNIRWPALNVAVPSFVVAASASPYARAAWLETATARRSESARTAASHSLAARVFTAPSVASTWRDVGVRRVYNLQVAETHEYFANGILVHNCWFDELAKYRYSDAVFDQAMFGLRLGSLPRWIVTTTPRPIALIRRLLVQPGVKITRGRSGDNLSNISPTYQRNVIDRYKGTRLGRQELDAEILDDVPGALWSRRSLDEARVATAPPFKRIVVGVDPAASSGEAANENGIIVAGIAENGHAYVIEDWSLRGSPDEWARKAVAAYRKNTANCLVAEVNQGGDMVVHTIQSVADIPVKKVRATKGKYVRAEPVSALYEQGRVHHVGVMPELEDQMVAFTPERAADRSDGYSPDRVDALVWALTELFPDITAPVGNHSLADDLLGGGLFGG